MSNPLTFLRPLRYDRVATVLLVQSGPLDLALEVAERTRALFPRCRLEALVREVDREAAAGVFDRVVPVRWEDRLEIVRQLRERRYDVVVMLLSGGGSDYLRLLPLLLRTSTILAFNDRLDYFPLHVTRLAALAHHVSGEASLRSLMRWGLTRVVLWPLACVVLLASVARLYLRAAWRRAHA